MGAARGEPVRTRTEVGRSRGRATHATSWRACSTSPGAPKRPRPCTRLRRTPSPRGSARTVGRSARTCIGTGASYQRLGDHLSGLEWLDRGIRILRAASDARTDLIYALRQRVLALQSLERFDEMDAARRELIAMHEDAGDRWNLIADLQYLYHDYGAFGREEEAMPEHARGFALLQDYLAGLSDTTRVQLTFLAGMAQRLGEYETAKRAWQQTLRKLSPGTDPYLVVMLGSRAAYHLLLEEAGDTDAIFENGAAALDAWSKAPRHQKERLLGSPGLEIVSEFMSRYAGLLQDRGREDEANGVRRTVEGLLGELR